MAGGDALTDQLQQMLATVLPPELGEVLLPALRWRPVPGRMIAVLPNHVWRDLFVEHGLDAARTFLRPHELAVHVICRLDAEVEARDDVKRFATFLQDPGNQLALAASRRVVEAPGLEHNPLFLHGPPGCGKSHLLTAIAGEFRAMLGDHAVLELSGPHFVAQEAQQLAERGHNELRQRLEQAAIVCLDEIDALANRALAQEELFHLINACLERGQQLAIAGQLSPRKLVGFEDRLVTRLMWGLAVPIEQPQTETRLVLVRQLAGDAAEAMDQDELAKLVDTLAPDMHQSVMLAERLREGEQVTTGSGMASFDRILETVAKRYELRPGDIAGKRRLRQVAWARQVALLLGRRLTAHSLEALGGMVGGRDHSTVLYSIRQAEERAKTDPEVARELAELTQTILTER
ncbi:MAG: AAA family ATPase [Planctomycetes bacterium]|nr:AAA family ATPase [Planctomycetota bacterium]